MKGLLFLDILVKSKVLIGPDGRMGTSMSRAAYLDSHMVEGKEQKRADGASMPCMCGALGTPGWPTGC